MTALIIIGIIVLIFALLLHAKIRAEVKFYDNVLDFKVKYLFFTVFPFKKKEKKEKKLKKKDKKVKKKKDTGRYDKDEDMPDTDKTEHETSENDDEIIEDTSYEDEESDQDSSKKKKKDKQKKSLSERLEDISGILEKVKAVWDSSKKGLKKLFLHIYFEDLVVDFTIAGEDAYKAAVNYGRISAAVYNLIAAMSVIFKTKVKSADIVCDFTGTKSVYNGEVKVTIRPSTILSVVFMILFGLIRNYKVLLGKKPKVKNQPDVKKAVTV